MFPYPSGEGLHVGHPRRLHRHRRLRPLHAHERPQRPARHGLRRVRPSRRAVRGGARAAPTCHGRRATSPPCAASSARWGSATTPRRSVATTDVRVLPVDAVDLPPDLQLVVRRRPGRGPVRSPSSSPSSRPARVPRQRRQPRRARRGPTSTRRRARAVVDSYRLAYLDEATVNWCPALGTVLANEEVTADGRSDRGNHPVFRRPLKQWKLQITAYADRLLADLDLLDWPESIKTMQRNWIGRSVGATVAFPVEEHEGVEIEVFTTRPDTLFGATYMVLAPEHPLLDEIVPERVARRHARAPTSATCPTRGRASSASTCCRRRRSARTASSPRRSRSSSGRPKAARRPACSPARSPRTPRTVGTCRSSSPTTCSWGTAPGRSWRCPRTTSATSSSRSEFDLPIAGVVRPPDGWLRDRGIDADTPAGEWPEAYVGDGVGMNSANDEVSLDGLPTPEAKQRIAEWLEASEQRRGVGDRTSCATGCSAVSATGASRSRSSTTTTTIRSRCRSRSCRSSCPR